MKIEEILEVFVVVTGILICCEEKLGCNSKASRNPLLRSCNRCLFCLVSNLQLARRACILALKKNQHVEEAQTVGGRVGLVGRYIGTS